MVAHTKLEDFTTNFINMYKVFKYQLPKHPETTGYFPCPKIIKVLKMSLQRQEPTMWALVDERYKAYYIIECIWTGEQFHALLDAKLPDYFTGTIQVMDDYLLHYLIKEIYPNQFSTLSDSQKEGLINP